MIVYLIMISIVIVLCVLCNRMTQRLGMPVLLAFIVLGMLFGIDGLLKIPFYDYALAEQICSIGLIFIMFYGGFGTSWSAARPVAPQALLLASLGVVITAVVTGLFCHLALGFELLEGLLLGAVVSSTDAATVFFILRNKKMGLKHNTASLLEVESGSNDPCSYMLTAIVLSVMGGSSGGGAVAYLVFAQLAYGLAGGFVIALIARWVLRHFYFSTAGFDMAFVIAVALLSYALPASVGGNGYLSAYIVGVVLGNTRFPNKKSLVHFFDGVTGLMQMLIFFLLGLLSTPSWLPDILPAALAVALFLTFVARPAAVFLLLTPFRCGWRQQLLVSFAGLRGAASIVFAIMATVSQAATRNDVFHIVFCIVLLSIAIQGTLLSPVAKLLGMSDADADIRKTFSDYSEQADLQFIRLAITPGHPWAGKAIRDLSPPPDTLLVMVKRGAQSLVPDGNTVLAPGDLAVLGARAFDDNGTLALKEQTIGPHSEWKGKTISEFSPSPGELVIMILRDGQTIIPKGDTVLLERDILVTNQAELPVKL